MNKIQNYNCDGLCIEKYCSERYEYFEEVELNGMKVLLGFCKKHSKK